MVRDGAQGLLIGIVRPSSAASGNRQTRRQGSGTLQPSSSGEA